MIILLLRALHLSLFHWAAILEVYPVRVQLDSAIALAYINQQGGTRSLLAALEFSWILDCAELHVPALSVVHILGVHNWQVDYLSQSRNQGE